MGNERAVVVGKEEVHVGVGEKEHEKWEDGAVGVAEAQHGQ